MAMADLFLNTQGGGAKVAQGATVPSGGRVDLGFSPTHIVIVTQATVVGCNVWDSSDSTNFKQYWQSSVYTYAVGSNNGGFAVVDSSGFTLDSSITANVKEWVAYG